MSKIEENNNLVEENEKLRKENEELKKTCAEQKKQIKKSEEYSGKGKTINKKGLVISGNFRLIIYSNGVKEFFLYSDNNIFLDIDEKISKKIFRFEGISENEEKIVIKKNILCGSEGRQIWKFLPCDLEIKEGKFIRGKKEVRYYLNNMNLGKISVYKRDFFIDKQKYRVCPYYYDKNSKDLLEYYGICQTTAIIRFETNSIYISNKTKTIHQLLYLLSFYTANYVSLEKIEIVQDNALKRIYFDDKKYPYSENDGILRFSYSNPISDVIEKTYPNFEAILNKINDFHDLIEFYIESFRCVTLEAKFALIAILFEALKERYIKSCLIDEHKRDNKGNYIKNKKGKRIKKSFKEILEEIFNLEKFRYSEKNLKLLIDIRNLVIHEGKSKNPIKKITFKKTTKAYYLALNIFERFMLEILGYKGIYLEKSHDKGFNWTKFR
ncbi:MAG: DUF667 domain-containing protein [Candidatus Aenigmarchaeota archaeon]|nr:DUF667 domain-containing protein [Candidatus Aenigmarchaeota archaeon]